MVSRERGRPPSRGPFATGRRTVQHDRLDELLDRIAAGRVGVVGDFCLDAYWTLLPRRDRSVETGRPVHLVAAQCYGLGGAGNVLANLAALGVRELRAFGVLGDDPFGREMIRLIGELGANSSGLVTQSAHWETPTYCKPYLGDQEQDRIDFGWANELSADSAGRLVAALAGAWDSLDALIVNQQLTRSIWTEATLAGLSGLVARGGEKPIVVVDSRDRPGEFPPAVLKVNSYEAAVMLGRAAGPDDVIPLEATLADGRRLFDRSGRPVLITRRERGSVVIDATGEHVVRGIAAPGPTDPVGAGDTTVAAFAAALAAGAAPAESAELANLASAVTVRKLRQTGTATPQEVRALAAEAG